MQGDVAGYILCWVLGSLVHDQASREIKAGRCTLSFVLTMLGDPPYSASRSFGQADTLPGSLVN